MDDPLALIYEKNMLRNIGAALTLAASPLAAKDSPQDYKTAASQIANYIKTFDSQINLTNDFNKRNHLLKQKENEISRLKFIINKLREMGVSDDEIRKLNK
jgi:hypothetical protein